VAHERSDKDKQASKSQSRAVSTGPKKKAPTKAGGRSTSTLLTWGAVGLVVVIVVVLVVVKLSGNSPSKDGGGSAYEPASASILKQVTQIPTKVYDTVGITSGATPVSAPVAITGQPPLTFKDSNGNAKPGFLYYGAEYCPYCAAERWPVIAALSRFGTYTGLGITASSATDAYPNTPSFTFFKSSFASEHLVVQAVESYTNIPTPAGAYTTLMKPTKVQTALVTKYDTAKFLNSSQSGGIPFIDMGNQFLISGSSFSPSILAGLSRSEIAQGLDDPTNPVTQAIVATANYITAAICKTTGGQPGNVCTSKGVKAAADAMKI